MGTSTSIEWTDATWNPIRGCSRVSEGCRNCYAEKVAYRFSGPGKPYEGLLRINAKGERVAEWNGQVQLVEKHLLDPLKWGPVVKGCLTGREIPHAGKGHCPSCTERPRRIFVNSMSDLFHENVPDEWIDRIFAVMALCPQHQFQVLTKRPERMLGYLSTPTKKNHWRREKDGREWKQYEFVERVERFKIDLFKVSPPQALNRASEINGLTPWYPLPNVWLGVSVENQAAADGRIPLLLQTPAAVRFISAEPLLGPVNLRAMNKHFDAFSKVAFDSLTGIHSWKHPDGSGVEFEGKPDPHLDWVIVGGESGPGARPMHPDWARSLRDQCQAAEVPFFFKQWGEWSPERPDNYCKVTNKRYSHETYAWGNNGEKYCALNPAPDDFPKMSYRVGKHAAGALLDGREWRQFPEAQCCSK